MNKVLVSLGTYRPMCYVKDFYIDLRMALVHQKGPLVFLDSLQASASAALTPASQPIPLLSLSTNSISHHATVTNDRIVTATVLNVNVMHR